MRKEKNLKRILCILVLILFFLFLISTVAGRYIISPPEIIELIKEKVMGMPFSNEGASSVLFQSRLPRIAAAILIGCALSVSGASYQGIFRNPMVSPDLLGASAGAGLLYLYKHAYGASVIGADEGQNSGNIEIAGGTVLIAMSMGGVAIGSEQCAGNITFSGGETYIYSDDTAPLMGAFGSEGSGHVSISGGALCLNNRYGQSVGTASDDRAGTVIITGGSVCDFSSQGISDCTTDQPGDPVYLCQIPVDASHQASGNLHILVDGKTFYQGKGHTWSYDNSSGYGVTRAFYKNVSSDLYLYLSGKDHAIAINGTVKYAVWDQENSRFS